MHTFLMFTYFRCNIASVLRDTFLNFVTRVLITVRLSLKEYFKNILAEFQWLNPAGGDAGSIGLPPLPPPSE